MNSKDQIIAKQKEYIEFLKNEPTIEFRKVWQEQCQLKELEIISLEQRLKKKPTKPISKTKQEEWKVMADKIRSLKGTDWGINF